MRFIFTETLNTEFFSESLSAQNMWRMRTMSSAVTQSKLQLNSTHLWQFSGSVAVDRSPVSVKVCEADRVFLELSQTQVRTVSLNVSGPERAHCSDLCLLWATSKSRPRLSFFHRNNWNYTACGFTWVSSAEWAAFSTEEGNTAPDCFLFLSLLDRSVSFRLSSLCLKATAVFRKSVSEAVYRDCTKRLCFSRFFFFLPFSSVNNAVTKLNSFSNPLRMMKMDLFSKYSPGLFPKGHTLW